MKYKKILLILMLVMVFSLATGSVTAKTENIKIWDDNSVSSGNSYKQVVKTTTKNFVITQTLKYAKKMVDMDSPFTGYLTVKSKNPKIKIKSIKTKIWQNPKLYWKTYKINSNKKTIKLGKNTLANVYENGHTKPYLVYIVNY